MDSRDELCRGSDQSLYMLKDTKRSVDHQTCTATAPDSHDVHLPTHIQPAQLPAESSSLGRIASIPAGKATGGGMDSRGCSMMDDCLSSPMPTLACLPIELLRGGDAAAHSGAQPRRAVHSSSKRNGACESKLGPFTKNLHNDS